MSDVLFQHFRRSLPDGVGTSLQRQIVYYENGDFQALFEDQWVKILLGREQDDSIEESSWTNTSNWNDFVFDRLTILLARRREDLGDKNERSPAVQQHLTFLVALAALQAFLQANVTGPPLTFSSGAALLPEVVSSDLQAVQTLRNGLLASLRVDGESVYKLTPSLELFCLADTVLTSPAIVKNVTGARWLRLRTNVVHQRLLSERSPSLQSQIYEELDYLSKDVLSTESNEFTSKAHAEFLLERASIHMLHGLDKEAREDIEQAAKAQDFEHALTGRLGRRTKYQDRDISQLVVLARSAESNGSQKSIDPSTGGSPHTGDLGSVSTSGAKPENLDLSDDTVLEKISFAYTSQLSSNGQHGEYLSTRLSTLDPSNQDLLKPLDSIVLLSLASSITDTSPRHGLTREETLPYAIRVLQGGSSNWQVYTQALLVRSRIEAYRSRTTERGLLQLQALVNQVIADTTNERASIDGSSQLGTPSTFLPRAISSESASVMDRLRYVYQLCSPFRWDLEAELASRWVSLGGLQSALAIYERLEMWAEAALCWAAVNREDKAIKIIRSQLFDQSKDFANGRDVSERWEGQPRDPPPPDAARLYCILGDVTHDILHYETAWTISSGRYARAQRSLGRHYFALRDFAKAADAYEKSLKVNQVDHSTWFAYGCALLELAQFGRAVEAFTRTVQLDDTDAEAWSNLSAALLRLETSSPLDPAFTPQEHADRPVEDAGDSPEPYRNPQRRKKEALKALKRAASLKYDDFRIWENLLVVAASTSPPSYADVVAAEKRIIEIRGPTVGEKCIDTEILELLVHHVLSIRNDSEGGYESDTRGLPRMVFSLFDHSVVPLITASRRLWQLDAKLALLRNKPSSALEANEKAWRAVISQPGWEMGTAEQWDEVVESTIELADAYESLGGRERTEGLGGGEAGQVVRKDWKFKARSAIRGIVGRARGCWEGTAGWERLRERLEDLQS